MHAQVYISTPICTQFACRRVNICVEGAWDHSEHNRRPTFLSLEFCSVSVVRNIKNMTFSVGEESVGRCICQPCEFYFQVQSCLKASAWLDTDDVLCAHTFDCDSHCWVTSDPKGILPFHLSLVSPLGGTCGASVIGPLNISYLFSAQPPILKWIETAGLRGDVLHFSLCPYSCCELHRGEWRQSQKGNVESEES